MKRGCTERAFRLCFRKGDKRMCHAKSCCYGLGFALKKLQFHMQRYRSGHNGADSKSVCEQSHEGSNPSLCAIEKTTYLRGNDASTWFLYAFLFPKVTKNNRFLPLVSSQKVVKRRKNIVSG